jgi:beta-lactam-binding protein with PASTA domain
MKKILLISLLLIITTGCSEFAILMSGSSLAISQNTYAKVYNAADMLTIMGTKKGIKRHAYDSAKKAWTGVKEGKEYIYDKTWGLTD